MLNTNVWGREGRKKGGKREARVEGTKELGNEGMENVAGVIVMVNLEHCQKVSGVH